MPDQKYVSLYKGRPVTEMTREELIEALETMERLYNQVLQWNLSEFRHLPERSPSRG